MRISGNIVRTILASLLAAGMLWIPVALVEAQEDAGQAPKPVAVPASATAASYVGSAACKTCHSKSFAAWTPTPHGQALSAETLPAEQRGCEACHGPGSEHVSTRGKTALFMPKEDDPKATNAMCGTCHFQSASSPVAKAAQTVSNAHFTRSMHGRKDLSCVTCHKGHPTGNDKQLTKPTPDLCLQCHGKVLESAPGKKAAYTHSPVAEGQCMTCHNPHGSSDRTLVAKDVQKACLTCHDVSDPQTLAAHDGYPVEDSECATCHDPHSHNRNASLVRSKSHAPFKHGKCETCHQKPVQGQPVRLNKPAGELCVSCHKASDITPAGEHAHAPARDGHCISCHNPHVSNRDALLTTRPDNACLTCHSKVEMATVQEHKHKVFNDNLHCASCHQPHSSTQQNLLIKDEATMCGQCHKHSFSHPIGKKADGKMVLNPTNGDPLVCSSCHEIHGSKHAALTIADKGRDLCVVCHNGLEH